MVRLRPQRQTLVTRSFGAYSKLGKRYYGPYQVVAQTGRAAYNSGKRVFFPLEVLACLFFLKKKEGEKVKGKYVLLKDKNQSSIQ